MQGNVGPQPNLVLIASGKGGVGKTTIAMNLGRALQRSGLNVAVADIDNATMSATRWVNNWRQTHPDEAGNPPLPKVSYFVEQVEENLLQLSRSNDLVLIDAGAGAPRQNRVALPLASLVLIPTAPSALDLAPAMELATEVRYLATRSRGLPLHRILLTRVDMRRSSSQAAVAQFQSEGLPFELMATALPESESLRNCAARGLSIFDYPATAALRQNFTSLAEEIMAILRIQSKVGEAA